jgi:hypothetical protein
VWALVKALITVEAAAPRTQAAARTRRKGEFIGCIWFNTARLCRGSKFKNICPIGIKADTLKKFPIQRQPFFCYNKKYTKAEKGLIPQGSALR